MEDAVTKTTVLTITVATIPNISLKDASTPKNHITTNLLINILNIWCMNDIWGRKFKETNIVSNKSRTHLVFFLFYIDSWDFTGSDVCQEALNLSTAKL